MEQSMHGLTENDTDQDNSLVGLPTLIEANGARPSLARTAPTAAFVSQLIAARDRLPPQRARRQGTVDGAIGAYGKGARIAERRMPQGYRKSVVD